MTEELMSARLISKAIMDLYTKLMDLISDNNEDSILYDETIHKIKKAVILEKKAYNKIDLLTIKTFFDKYDSKSDTPTEKRMYEKLTERMDRLTEKRKLQDGTLFTNVVDSKIIIDSFRIIRKRILSIKDENQEDELFKRLVLYYHISKFSLFTTNSYIEDIALECNFNVDKMPNITFEDINKMYNIDSLKIANDDLCLKVYAILSILNEINNSDGVLNDYLALTELSNIETILNYLEYNEVSKLETLYQTIFSKTTKPQLITAKKLIRNRLKELNKN